MFLRSAVLLRLRFEVPEFSHHLSRPVSPAPESIHVEGTCRRYMVPFLGNHVSRILM